ncbi:MAG: ABC transporter permease [Lachnospiraceae bacterium]|nr:ABC transporter permease [Lachnospiraceae bacterium]
MTGLSENLSVALTSIMANKLRSVLTMLGIIIGISAVITIVSIGAAQAKQTQDQMNNQGFANLSIQAKQKEGAEKNDDNEIIIDTELLGKVYAKYADQCEGISLYDSFEYSHSEEWKSDYLKTKRDSVKTCLNLINSGYFLANKRNLLYGSFITPAEYKNGSRVIMITDKAAKILFGAASEDCIGQEVEGSFGNIYSTFTVKGIVEPDGQWDGGWYEDPMTGEYNIAPYTYLPLKAYENITGTVLKFESAVIIPKTNIGAEAILGLVDDVKADLNSGAADYIEYNVSSSIDYIQQAAAQRRNQFLITALVAAIALIVGGIGVMNIMMVSITERTKEIGTRKALGATNGSVLLQFITESILLCLIGGVIGIAIGIAGGIIACKIMKMAYVLEPLSIIVAVGFSLLIGTFFGYYPASRAAKMDPIEALRYE